MAYASNALIWKKENKQIVVMVVLKDSEDIFKDLPTQGYVMAHTELIGGMPVIYFNGESVTDEEWYAKCDGNAPYGKMSIGQLLTSPVWLCRKVKNIMSSIF